MTKNKIILLVVIGVCVAIGVFALVFFGPSITGNPVSQPDEVYSPEVEERRMVSSQDAVEIDNVTTGAFVTSPLTVTGKVLLPYLDENNSFLVELRSMEGVVLGSSQATVGEVGESDYVLFSATVAFDTAGHSGGLLMITQPALPRSGTFGYQVRFAK